ncbi:transposase [Amycolatopsis echigonensis]|uniref:Transposase n=1 Tax=Amycolatopsis echigonensis TaxID=2576905 RepID=A0A2N3WFD2_9PSEU|nr:MULTISPECIES: IS110 family transposase [Amycolatopsis]PKV92592.1 transposase [Amycolatopsis niigatensis]
MDVVIQRCAGIDIGKKTMAVTIRTPGQGKRRRTETRTFATMTDQVLALRDWLLGEGVEVAGMEATGDYWKPVFYLLEDALECWLLNAGHLKAVPGRKTDVKDSEWIAQLVEHGLVRPSFVPPPPIRELRDLTRYRKTVIEERTREVQRLEKILEDAGIKLSSVASSTVSVSGRAMLAALIDGERDPAALANLAKGRMRRKTPILQQALRGRFDAHHAVLVREMLARIDAADATVARLCHEIAERLRPFQEQLDLLMSIPGIARRNAEVLIAETGGDMTAFGSPHRLAAWAGLAPGNNESAGKHRPGHTRKGNKWLGSALVESAHAAARTKNTYLAAQYWRLSGRRGKNRAAVAVAHSILVIAYHLLDRHQPYRDLGGDYFTSRLPDHAHVRRLVAQLERLGQHVTLTPNNPEAA